MGHPGETVGLGGDAVGVCVGVPVMAGGTDTGVSTGALVLDVSTGPGVTGAGVTITGDVVGAVVSTSS